MEKKYFDFLKERSFKGKKYWYTHRKLRASRSHIKNAIPYMFHYLNDKNIKRSTNDLEGLNGLIFEQIKRHRGLRIDRLISLISFIKNRSNNIYHFYYRLLGFFRSFGGFFYGKIREI